MTRKIFTTTIMLVALGSASSATAGYAAGAPVYIDTASRVFVGTLSSVRNTADTVQYIQIQNSANGSSEYVAFSARDASGKTATCYSYAANIISVAKTILPDSHLQVNWGQDGVCTALTVYNSSWSPPKNH
jgi:hypothetical protein